MFYNPIPLTMPVKPFAQTNFLISIDGESFKSVTANYANALKPQINTGANSFPK